MTPNELADNLEDDLRQEHEAGRHGIPRECYPLIAAALRLCAADEAMGEGWTEARHTEFIRARAAYRAARSSS